MENRNLLLGISAVIAILILVLCFKDCSNQPEYAEGFPDETEAEVNTDETECNDEPLQYENNLKKSASELEMQVITEVNKCRSNPPLYAEDVLEPFLASMDNGVFEFNGQLLLTYEGAAAVTEAIKVLKSTSVLSTLTYSEQLHLLAKDHCDNQVGSGTTGHERAGNISFQDAARKFGLSGCGECISYGFNDPQYILIQLLVDDGVKSRGHRDAILDPKYTKLGVSCGPHIKFDHMCVLDFQI